MTLPLPSRPTFPFLPQILRGGFRLPAPPRLDRPETLGRLGALEVRLAADAGEVKRAQRLRYRVFFEEMAAQPGRLAALKRRDVDAFDAVCDHLLVLDHEAGRPGRPKVVGTYRLLRQERAARTGFYTEGEFDLAPLLARHREARFLELGRSCVLAPYRTKRTIELLWAGIWAYVQAHRIDAMLGCASFPGTDPDALALPLAFLHHRAASPPAWQVAARPALRVAMDRLPADSIENRAALAALPPLVKAYLRVGATVGDGAVVDRAFATTDVFVVMPVAAIGQRYLSHFGPAANRFAA